MTTPKPLAGKTITLPVFIHGERADRFSREHERNSVFDGFKLRASSWSSMLDGEFHITKATVVFTVPADFDPVAPMVSALEAEKAKLTAEFTAKVRDINRRLSELQAIEFDGAEA